MAKQHSHKSLFLYEKIAMKIATQIRSGLLKPEDKITSIKKLSIDLNVNKSTIEKAYAELEDLGLIIAKPQSGYYVRSKTNKVLPETEITKIETAISRYNPEESILSIQDLATVPNIFSLGAAIPSSDVLPTKKLNRIISKIGRSLDPATLDYSFPPGYYKLRKEIAKHAITWNCNFSPEEIIITSGAMDAISLCLRAIAKPGDTIIIESPTYVVILLLLQSLGFKILEIPTHPKEGIHTPSLRQAIEEHQVSGCILYPTLSNPLSAIMSQKKRKEVYNLLSSKRIPIIEANIHGELCFDHSRPPPIKTIDDKGIVLYAYSFSKTVAPGFRIGYVVPGPYYEKVRRLKLINSLATTSITQIAIAEFIKSGGYDQSIKSLRKTFSSRVELLSNYITEYFPDGTKYNKPRGGYYFWVELPRRVNTIKLQREALEENISIAPGPMFTTKSDYYINYLRLSCAIPNWSINNLQNAIKKLGELIKKHS